MVDLTETLDPSISEDAVCEGVWRVFEGLNAVQAAITSTVFGMTFLLEIRKQTWRSVNVRRTYICI